MIFCGVLSMILFVFFLVCVFMTVINWIDDVILAGDVRMFYYSPGFIFLALFDPSSEFSSSSSLSLSESPAPAVPLPLSVALQNKTKNVAIDE